MLKPEHEEARHECRWYEMVLEYHTRCEKWAKVLERSRVKLSGR